MTARVAVGTVVLLLVVVLGLWVWSASGETRLDRVLLGSAMQDDLREAHTSLLGARVDVYEQDFQSARRRLERVRGLLRRANERSTRLNGRSEGAALELDRFEADLDEAQQLLISLDRETDSAADRSPGLTQGEPRNASSVRR